MTNEQLTGELARLRAALEQASEAVGEIAWGDSPCKCLPRSECHHAYLSRALAATKIQDGIEAALSGQPAPDALRDSLFPGCRDCGAPYGEDGWCDVVIPNEIWNKINGGPNGVLCFRCMTKRLEAAGYGEPGKGAPVIIASGPYKDDDEEWRLIGLRHGYELGKQDRLALKEPPTPGVDAFADGRVVLLFRDEEGHIIARIPDFQGLITHGDTPDEAVRRAGEVRKMWLEMSAEDGLTVPPPPKEPGGFAPAPDAPAVKVPEVVRAASDLIKSWDRGRAEGNKLAEEHDGSWPRQYVQPDPKIEALRAALNAAGAPKPDAVAEVANDTALLDWLEKQGDNGEIIIDGDLIGERQIVSWNAWGKIKTPREALRAALAAMEGR